MDPDPALVTSIESSPGVVRMVVDGVLAASTVDQLRVAMEEVDLTTATRLELDLAAATVQDPDALVVLLDFHLRARGHRCVLALVNVPEQVAEAIAQTMIAELIDIQTNTPPPASGIA